MYDVSVGISNAFLSTFNILSIDSIDDIIVAHLLHKVIGLRKATRYHCVVILFQALSHSTNDGETYVYVATPVYQKRKLHASSWGQDYLVGQMLVVKLVVGNRRYTSKRDQLQSDKVN